MVPGGPTPCKEFGIRILGFSSGLAMACWDPSAINRNDSGPHTALADCGRNPSNVACRCAACLVSPPPPSPPQPSTVFFLSSFHETASSLAAFAAESLISFLFFCLIAAMLASLRLAYRAFGVRSLSSQGLPITTVRVSNEGVDQRKSASASPPFIYSQIVVQVLMSLPVLQSARRICC